MFSHSSVPLFSILPLPQPPRGRPPTGSAALRSATLTPTVPGSYPPPSSAVCAGRASTGTAYGTVKVGIFLCKYEGENLEWMLIDKESLCIGYWIRPICIACFKLAV